LVEHIVKVYFEAVVWWN